MRKEFTLSTHKISELIDITAELEKAISASGLKNGICIVYIPHTTACVCINENADPSVGDKRRLEGREFLHQRGRIGEVEHPGAAGPPCDHEP